jgi:hypothetical protein
MGSVFCILKDPFMAEAVARELEQVGFAKRSISMLFAKKGKIRARIRQKHSRIFQGALWGMSLGAVLGWALGFLAWYLSPAMSFIPGASLISNSPLLGTWLWGAFGAFLGADFGAILGFLVPEYQVKAMETRLKNGDVLLSVRTENHDQAQLVQRIFCCAEARNITVALGMAS